MDSASQRHLDLVRDIFYNNCFKERVAADQGIAGGLGEKLFDDADAAANATLSMTWEAGIRARRRLVRSRSTRTASSACNGLDDIGLHRWSRGTRSSASRRS